MSSVWVKKMHGGLSLNQQEERIKEILIAFGLRHEVHRIFSVGNRSLVVDFYLPAGKLILECWSSRSRRGTALTWIERDAAHVDLKFKKLKENYPGIRCLALVEAPTVDLVSLQEIVGALMVHADFISYSIEDFE